MAGQGARRQGEPLGEAAEVDASAVRRLQALFDRGGNVSKGEKLIAGIEHFAPEFGRHGGLHLPRSCRALQEWRRRCPPRSRRPLAPSIWAATAREMRRDILGYGYVRARHARDLYEAVGTP